ncbi:carbohydrate-binding module family 1 protein [Gonapodya prolifera JEL478]|uniref:Carbohydrate-binding module family 1 protein n=1 Tax=Gonapodya prolifera (strain JEL478) TaxID=1344416 RepID=A0A139AXI2_GONPJ|nr:carbohydrate-binding module family 1 protein [Gonapodya prolifera JEL478]|eukprot:KXS21283.1 carbohydrate-binding module family 1 protein [Gonapodya prolifera JEL478]
MRSGVTTSSGFTVGKIVPAPFFARRNHPTSMRTSRSRSNRRRSRIATALIAASVLGASAAADSGPHGSWMGHVLLESRQACAAMYYQCGGDATYTGPKCCMPGSVCVVQNPYYYQCVAAPSTTSSSRATSSTPSTRAQTSSVSSPPPSSAPQPSTTSAGPPVTSSGPAAPNGSEVPLPSATDEAGNPLSAHFGPSVTESATVSPGQIASAKVQNSLTSSTSVRGAIAAESTGADPNATNVGGSSGLAPPAYAGIGAGVTAVIMFGLFVAYRAVRRARSKARPVQRFVPSPPGWITPESASVTSYPQSHLAPSRNPSLATSRTEYYAVSEPPEGSPPAWHQLAMGPPSFSSSIAHPPSYLLPSPEPAMSLTSAEQPYSGQQSMASWTTPTPGTAGGYTSGMETGLRPPSQLTPDFICNMADNQDADLFAAVEGGDTVRVLEILSNGGNARARKKVTMLLDVKVDRKLVRRNRIRDDDYEDILETRTDTADCETLLAVAILRCQPQIVEALLEHGADPNAGVSWRIARNEATPWPIESWNARWVKTIWFPNAVALAVAVGGKMTNSQGTTVPRPGADGKVEISPKGATVIVEQKKDTYVSPWLTSIKMEQHVGVVRSLMARGATVPPSVLDGVNPTTHPSIYWEVQNAYRSQNPPLVSPPTQRTDTGDFAVLLAEQARKIEDLTRRAFSAESHAAQLDVRNGEMQTQKAQLESKLSSLEALIKDFEADMAALQNRNLTLEKELASLNGENAALRRNEQPGTNFSSQRLLREPKPPMALNQMMFAISEFMPTEQDEIHLSLGDAIYVSLTYPDGWGSGLNTSTNLSGHFPLSHVSPFAPGLPSYGVSSAAISLPAASRFESLPQHVRAPLAEGRSPFSQSIALTDVLGPPRSTIRVHWTGTSNATFTVDEEPTELSFADLEHVAPSRSSLPEVPLSPVASNGTITPTNRENGML